jgi:hypothetical protein
VKNAQLSKTEILGRDWLESQSKKYKVKTINYTVYTKSEILNRGINSKENKFKIFTLFFKINCFMFAVIYEPRYFKSLNGLAHFDFYALSRGFEKFTETGYRSCFVQNSKKVASYEEIRDYFVEQFKDKVALEDKSLKPVQLALF